MKKLNKYRFIWALFIVLCLWTNTLPQDALGGMRLVDIPSPSTPPLRERTPVRTMVRTPRLLFRVGGVAFDGVAEPAPTLTVNSLKLDYQTVGRSDGSRLSVTINGTAVSNTIYDWQLIPIAKFADSQEVACVTLFGTLGDQEKDKEIWSKRGEIVNYHEAFQHTLLGLRLFQLDGLIFFPAAYDLPTKDGIYLLGRGESLPNIKANKLASNNFGYDFLEFLGSYESYVISDYQRRIQFNSANGKLTISGEPSYFFWRKEGTKVELSNEKKNQLIEIENSRKSERQINSGSFDEKQWLINLLVKEANIFDEQIGNSKKWRLSASLINLLQTEPAKRQEILQSQIPKDLEDQLAELRAFLKVLRIKEINGPGAMISNNTAKIRAINPAVWDAGVNTMRYAAFFRYYKQQYPEQWRAFMVKINAATMPPPPVRTPSAVYF